MASGADQLAGGPGLCTAFVALQPIDAAMGATVFFPRTHTAEAHALFSDREGDGRGVPHDGPRELKSVFFGKLSAYVW